MSTTTLQRILVPTDLSEFSGTACRWAGMLQRRVGARLTLLYANEPYVGFGFVEGPAMYMPPREEELHALTAKMREHVERFLPDVGDAAETMIVDKAPAPAIVETAESIDADLIVMGTHGRTGLRRVILGSVAESVVRHTDRPVLCIPSEAPAVIGKIFCPVNFTNVARVAIEQASALAETFDAELLVAHVSDAPDRKADESDLVAWIGWSVGNRCRYSYRIASGNAAEETIRMARDAKADLIVLGSQHKRFVDTTVIGTTTERVVRYARKPVWIVTAPSE